MSGAESPRRVHAVEWVYLAVGAAAVWRHFFLFDDAFVYFRYVDNLLFLDLGLVYNAGEYVEGYSSPLWVLILTALRATGLDWTVLVRAGALAGFAGFWALAVAVNRRLAPPGVVLNFPLAFLCGLYGVSTWFSSGAETPLVQLLAPAYALFALRPGSLPLQVLVALSPLVRQELVLSLGVALLWAWRAGGRIPWRLGLLAGAGGAGWMAFRIVYYADLFPSTFYLKSEFDPVQGLVYLWDTAAPYGLWAVVPVFAVLALWLRAPGAGGGLPRPGPRAFMLLAALPVAAYAVAIGGTSTHYRYLAFPMCLALFSTAGLAERALVRAVPRGAGRIRAHWLAPALGLAVLAVGAGLRPAQLDAPRFNVGKIGDAAYHRWRIAGAEAIEARVHPTALRAARAGGAPMHRGRVIVAGWCANAYAAYDARVVHRFGLTDPVLARVATRSWRPGHKRQLGGMAEDLATLQRHALEAGDGLAPGLFRRAIEEGRAPAWVVDNAASLERIERKTYNRHDPLENLALAFTFPDPIRAPRSGDD